MKATAGSQSVFQLEGSVGGGAINLSGTPSGTHHIWVAGLQGVQCTFDVDEDTVTIESGSAILFGQSYANQPVYIWSTGDMPMLADGSNRLVPGLYFLKSATSNTKTQISSTAGGAAIELDSTDIGTGIHYISYVNWGGIFSGDTVHIQDRQAGNLGTGSQAGLLHLQILTSGVVIEGVTNNQIPNLLYSWNAPSAYWTQQGATAVYHTTQTFSSNGVMARSSLNDSWTYFNPVPRYLSVPATDNQLALFQPGDWGISDTTLYVRPTAALNADPNNDYYGFNASSSPIMSCAPGIHDVTFADLTLGPFAYILMYHSYNGLFDNIYAYNSDTPIKLVGQCDNTEATNLAFVDFVNGVYAYGSGASTYVTPTGYNDYTDGLNVHDSTFSKSFKIGRLSNSNDFHAIAMQVGTDFNCYSNSFSNVGTAATYWTDNYGPASISLSYYKNFINGIWRPDTNLPIEYIVPGNPTTVVVWNHPYSNDNTITISGITQEGWTSVNGNQTVAGKTTHTFTVDVDTSGNDDDYNSNTDAGVCKKTGTKTIFDYPCGAGLDVQGTTQPTEINYSIFNNILTEVDGISIRSGLSGGTGTKRADNNTMRRVNVGISYGLNQSTAVTLSCRNNIIDTILDLGCGVTPAFVFSGNSSDPTTWTMVWDYNLYYPNVSSGTPFYWYGGAISYATWQAKTFSGSVHPDANSKTTDPRFLNAGGSYALATDFIPQAILPGTNLSAYFTTDYAGSTRIFWQMGAYNWVYGAPGGGLTPGLGLGGGQMPPWMRRQ